MPRSLPPLPERVVWGVAGFALWLVAWQVATTVGPLAGISGIPTMAGALSEAIGVTADPGFWASLAETLGIALAGLVIALAVGITLGVVTAVWRTGNEVLDPLIQLLRPLPAVVILPLLLLILGPTTELGISLAAYGAIWPILVQTQAGIRDVDPVMLDVACSMTLPWLTRQRVVVLPGAAPFIITGVRIGATAALLLAIGAGLLGGSPGLGRRILLAQESAQPELTFGLILWSGIIGVLFAVTLNAAERTILRGRRPSGLDA